MTVVVVANVIVMVMEISLLYCVGSAVGGVGYDLSTGGGGGGGCGGGGGLAFSSSSQQQPWL